MAELNDRIVPLDQLDDFGVAEGDPDVRGWEVLASDGRRIGSVEQLLVDTGAMKVRYLDVDLDEEALGEGSNEDRHILIPIGYARLDEDGDQVFVDQLSVDQIRTIPAYTHEPLTRDYETNLRQSLDRDFRAEPVAETGFYEHEHYDDNRFFGSRRGTEEGETRMTLSEEELAVGKREVRAGEVEIDKNVETRHVREQVPTRHDEVIVERRPATPGMGANARIEEGEIHVPVTEEELIVQKRAVPTEELVVRKREVIENETVEADLRRERAEVHREGDVRLEDEGRRGL